MSPEATTHVTKWRSRFAIVGAIALTAIFVGAFFERQGFFASYLFAWFFWFGLSIGCGLIAMIHHLTGGRWGYPVRRFVEAGAAVLPIMALLFLPIFFGLRELYPWAAHPLDAEIQKKSSYLNPPFFIVRAIIYFAVWAYFAWRLRAGSLEQDRTARAGPSRRLLRLSGVGVVAVPLLATFAYIDWIMSLEPKWHSTVFPLALMAGQTLAGYCFAVIALRLFGDDKHLAGFVSDERFHELGNLVLTFVLFWTYLAFSQLLIIYSANKPDEIAWYLHRIAGGWKALTIVIAAFNFLAPFLLLLFRRVKRNRNVLAMLAVALMAAHLIYNYWVIKPAFPGVHVNWTDFVAPIGVGGIWLAVCCSLLQRAPLLPENDPRMEEELAYAED